MKGQDRPILVQENLTKLQSFMQKWLFVFIWEFWLARVVWSLFFNLFLTLFFLFFPCLGAGTK